MPATGDTLATIERFLAAASRPVLIEAGEAEIPLTPAGYSIEKAGPFLYISAWTSERTYRRRIMHVRKVQPGRIEVSISRLGRPEGVLTLFDAGYGKNDPVRKRGQRERFREQFRMMLSRQFPDWKLAELSTAPDLENSLSPSFPRALLRRGTARVAAIAAPPESLNPDALLTFGLIWLDYLRKREKDAPVTSLAIFAPEHASRTAALRLRWLNPASADFQLFVFRETGEMLLDPRDWGNLETRLEAPARNLPVSPGPEAELEMAVRNALPKLDARLAAAPVYRQAPAIAGRDRGIADLVAIDIDSGLAVLELKVKQDINLPLQALDYWMRVKWHSDRGDFARLGYFPARELAPRDPVLYLIAPALEFHPSTGTLIRFFNRRIPIVLLGIGANWREDLKVISRQDWNEHYQSTA